MQRIQKLTVTIVIMLLTSTAHAQQRAAPPMESYAWGFPVQVAEEASIYAVELPLAVHQSVSDAQLRDAGVYNSAGQAVPRIFQPSRDQADKSERQLSLKALPLFEQAPSSPEDLRLLLEREGDKTTLQLNAREISDRSPDTTLAAYLIDTRELQFWPSELTLTWQEGLAGFIGSVSIEGSNNLQDWRQAGQGAVADLREADTHVLQNRVKIGGTKRKFLRISWQGLPDDWRLTQVNGMADRESGRSSRKFVELQSSGLDPDDGGYLFDLGGALAVDRLRLVLPQPNTIVGATLYYRLEPEHRWLPAAAGSHYRLGRGDASVVSKPVAISPARARQFKVMIQRGSAGSAPKLELGYRPDTLIFLAQGEPPFVLAAGRPEDATDQFPQDRFFADGTLGTLARKGQSASASLGERFGLGGSTDLRPEPVISWRRWGLWAALLAGVALVLWMAFRVVRDL